MPFDQSTISASFDPSIFFSQTYALSEDEAIEITKETFRKPYSGLIIVKHQNEWFMSNGIDPETNEPYEDSIIERFKKEFDQVIILD